MGIINVTPDSFSDGGRFLDADAAVAQGRRLKDEGADLLDVGAESTRPGAEPVSLDEELRRLVPVVRGLVERVGLPVSVDTRKAAVFREAWKAGASMLNDVSGLRHDAELAKEAAATDAAVIVMHSRGDPATMDGLAVYEDVLLEVVAELGTALERAREAGIAPDLLVADPGLGFAKTGAQSLEILRGIDRLRLLGRPLAVGPSRKRFLGEITGRKDPAERDAASMAAAVCLALHGVEIIRLHAVQEARDATALAHAIRKGA